MKMGRAVLAALAAMSWSSCSCRTTAIKSNVGELVIVIPQADGELLTREAQVTVADVAMEDVGVTSVKLRNIGNAPLTIATVTREPGGEVFDLDLPDGTVIDANAELDVSARFAPPQAADATVVSVPWAGTFRFDLVGVAADQTLVSLDLKGNALARDCYVPAAVDFGEVVPGQRVSVPFTLTNGKRAASVTTFGAVAGADAAVFQVGATEPVSVPPGASTQVPLWFAPKAEAEYRATLEVQRGPQCAKVNVALSGRGSATALSWTPARLDFGRTPLSLASAPQTVTVTNRSKAVLSVSAASVGADYTLTAPSSVPGGGTATFLVSCRPQTLGQLTEALTFVLGTDPATIVTIPLTCIGGGPRIRVTPTALNFGAIPVVRTGEVVAIRRLTVQNVGTPPATPGDTSNNLVLGERGRPPLVSVLPVAAGTTSADFEVTVPSSYPTAGLPAVAGSNSADLEVRFAPKTLGAKSAELRIYSNDTVTPVTKVVLTANAFEGQSCAGVTVSPVGLSFGDSQIGATLDRAITVENRGTTPCQVFGADMVAGSSPAFTVLDQTLITIAPSNKATIRVRATVPRSAVQGDILRGAVRVSLPGAVQKVVPVDLKVSTCLVVAPTVLEFGTTGLACRSEGLAVTLYNACALPITLEALAVTAPFRIMSAPPITAGGVEVVAGEPQLVTVAFVPTQVAVVAGALTVTVVEGGVQRVVTVPLSGEGAIDSHHQDSWTQGKGDVDILFVIDDSCSMADEQAALAANFQSFIQHATSTGANFQLGVTTTDVFAIGGQLVGNPTFFTPSTPSLVQTFQQRALVGTGGSGQEEPLEALLRAVTPPRSTGANAGFLRPGVPLAAVIVTDAVDQSPLAVSVYLSKLRAAKGNRADLVNVSVVGPFTQPSVTCLLDSTVDDGRYADVLAATHGAKGDICTTDWAKDLDAIGSSVLGLNARFPLTAVPGPASSIEVTVNGAPLPATAWSLDPATRQVILTNPPATGAMVTARFDTACYAP